MTFRELEAAPRITILGFGVEGQGSYRFLRKLWPTKPVSIVDRRPWADLVVSEDLKNIVRADRLTDYYSSEFYEAELVKSHTIIKSPGIPQSDETLRRAVSLGATVTTHFEILFANYPSERLIAVTGTKGKSTTTTLLFEMIHRSGIDAVLAGNIGQPPLPQINWDQRAALVVCEMSSHQLQPLTKSPGLAGLLNVFPEHLDYYRTFSEYKAAKEKITQFQGPSDWLVYSCDDKEASDISSRSNASKMPYSPIFQPQPGCFVASGSVVFSGKRTERLFSVEEVALRGSANLLNVLAASALARLAGANAAAIRDTVRSFKGLPHRLENVGTFRGVEFVDDSIATIPEATAAALSALQPRVQTLIAGGYDRHLSFDLLSRAIMRFQVENLILFLPTGEQILGDLKRLIGRAGLLPNAVFVSNMEEAVAHAYRLTSSGRICLLSPASASFGTFVNYADRGDQFQYWARKLGKSGG